MKCYECYEHINEYVFFIASLLEITFILAGFSFVCFLVPSPTPDSPTPPNNGASHKNKIFGPRHDKTIILLASNIAANQSAHPQRLTYPALLGTFNILHNIDKHHSKYFHRAQCTQHTPLALDNFGRFPSNSTFTVVIQNAVGYRFFMQITH